MDEQAQLERWADDYGIDGSKILFKEYAALTKDVLGTCACTPSCQSIRVNKGLEGHDLYVTATLWHEFCHAWVYQGTGSAAHSGAYWSRYARKWWYVIVDFFAAIHLHTH